MAHIDWWGEECGDCVNPCALDESMPCSPNCESLAQDGSRNVAVCRKSGCDAYEDGEDE